LKNVILLAPYFLPRRRVGSWRPFKFAIHLREFGWKPHIIAINEPSESLTEREAQLLAGIPIHKIESPFDFTHQLGPQLEYNGSNPQVIKRKSAESSQNSFKPLLNWVDKHFPIDTWLPLLYLRMKSIQQFVKEVNPHLLWSTGDPWSSHWLGKKIAERHDIPWVADFRDPWTLGNITLKKRANFAHRIDQKHEQKTIKAASSLTFTSKSTRALYTQTYPKASSKAYTIYNSFDSTLFKEEEPAADIFNDDHLNLIFFGKFRPLSPAEPFINILHHLKQQHPDTAPNIRMHSFGSLSEKERKLARAKDVYQNFVRFKPIALENALSVLGQADILWLSTHPQRTNIIPAKLWDYLAARRPVLSVAPNAEIDDILTRAAAGIHFKKQDVSVVANLLHNSFCAKKRGQPMPFQTSFDDKAIKQYDADVSTQKLAHIFDDLT
jgi:glycosyltransferase involved in cell wall biosynthesis